MDRIRKKPAVVLFMAILIPMLSACTIPDGARSGLRAVEEKDGMIVFSETDSAQAAVERIVYANPWERDEYVLYQSPDFQAEFVHITTRNIYLENLMVGKKFGLDDALSKFRHNQTDTLVSGVGVLLKINDNLSWAKPYQLPEEGKACAVFSGEWGVPKIRGEHHNHYTNALFGYFCRASVEPLSLMTIEQVLARLKIRNDNKIKAEGGISSPVLNPKLSQSDLLRRAQGGAEGKRGITDFPYKVVREYYSPSVYDIRRHASE